MDDLMSLDIVAIECEDNTAMDLAGIRAAVGRRKFYQPLFKVVERALREYGYKLFDIVGSFVYATKDHVMLCIDTRDMTMEITSKKRVVYGVVVPSNGYPFVYYIDGSANYVPYDCIASNCIGTYRSAYANNEIFVLRATSHFVYPDIYASLAGQESNLDIARSLKGDASINYIYVVFALLGVDFPEYFGDDGADASMFLEEKYGFRKL